MDSTSPSPSLQKLIQDIEKLKERDKVLQLMEEFVKLDSVICSKIGFFLFVAPTLQIQAEINSILIQKLVPVFFPFNSSCLFRFFSNHVFFLQKIQSSFFRKESSESLRFWTKHHFIIICFFHLISPQKKALRSICQDFSSSFDPKEWPTNRRFYERIFNQGKNNLNSEFTNRILFLLHRNKTCNQFVPFRCNISCSTTCPKTISNPWRWWTISWLKPQISQNRTRSKR